MEEILKSHAITIHKFNNEIFIEANEFGKILELNNIRASICNFSEEESQIFKIKTKGVFKEKIIMFI